MKKPKKKRKLPKDITERPDREVLEKVLGQHVMKRVDKMTGRDEEPAKSEDEEVSTEEDNHLAASI